MVNKSNELVYSLTRLFVDIISETNGLSLMDTIDLALQSEEAHHSSVMRKHLKDFRQLLFGFEQNSTSMKTIMEHPVAIALYNFLLNFPIRFREEHIHLTGSLEADFIYAKLKELMNPSNEELIKKRVVDTFGADAWPINSAKDVDNLIRLKATERFDRYLQILDLAKIVLVDREAHVQAAYSMAKNLYEKYNVGFLRLKFTLSRSATNEVPIHSGGPVSPEDVVTGLYEGFKTFQMERPDFDFVLSPSFRKEPDYYNSKKFSSKREDFLHQVNELLEILERYPEIGDHLREVDTVGNERELYAKRHFNEMKTGFRKLQYYGFKIRSHHGEVWKSLNKGIQAVDNAMNIWHIDTLEHGLSLGVNPNYYFHSLFQKVMIANRAKEKIDLSSLTARELMEMSWNGREDIRDKILRGDVLEENERVLFLKAKFHTAREVEHYQHDVLNRLKDKEVSLVSLPSSNSKLTHLFPDYRDHPFSWWEKKGVKLGVGTDNYVTLNTDYIREMLILLFSDPHDLKLTKLLLVCTGETSRPYLSHLMWKLRKTVAAGEMKPIQFPFSVG
jgi:adenosine deaminase